MVVLNEQGFDRVAVGEQLPDPNIGRRMFTLSGVAWNDAQRFERGGLGLDQLPDGKSRPVIGVDNQKGEAVHMIALEDGTNALSIHTEQGILLLGSSGKDGMLFDNKEDFTGVKYFDKKWNLIWQHEVRPKRNRGHSSVLIRHPYRSAKN